MKPPWNFRAGNSREGAITEAGDMLIYWAGFPVIYGRQPLYFQDATFAARVVC
jgi:hypothetical protein